MAGQSSSGPNLELGSASLQLSSYVQTVLRGGAFDARKVLVRPRGNDPEEDKAFRAKLRLLDHLNHAKPEVVHDTLMSLEEKLLGLGKEVSPKGKAARESEFWNDTYMRCCKIPKYWRADWILRHFGHVFSWTQDDINNIDEQDGNAISYIFDFLTGTTPNTHLPRCMIYKKACDEIFFARAMELGRGTEEWAGRAVDINGKMDWSNGGVYRFLKVKTTTSEAAVDGEEKAEQSTVEEVLLEHISGARVKWETAFSVKTVVMESNCWDMTAKIALGKQDLPLHRFFDKGIGPNVPAILNTKGEYFDKSAAKLAKDRKLEPPREQPASASASTMSLMEDALDANLKKKRAAQVAAKAAAGKRRKNLSLMGEVTL